MHRHPSKADQPSTEMRVNQKNRSFILSGAVLAAFIFSIFLPEISSAQNINFSQAILPVKFVYLDNQGEIERIWSNVTVRDTAYVVKFFDEKKNQELRGEKTLFEKYVDSNLLRPQQEFLEEGRIVLNTDFVKNSKSMIEEVKTVV